MERNPHDNGEESVRVIVNGKLKIFAATTSIIAASM